MKLDIASNIAAPGLGNGWVNPGQPAADFAPPGTYNSQNPVAILTFDVIWSGSTIDFGMVLNSTPNRAMAIYIASDGTDIRLSSAQVSVNTARLTIPAPGMDLHFAAAVCAAMALRRR